MLCLVRRIGLPSVLCVFGAIAGSAGVANAQPPVPIAPGPTPVAPVQRPVTPPPAVTAPAERNVEAPPPTTAPPPSTTTPTPPASEPTTPAQPAPDLVAPDDSGEPPAAVHAAPVTTASNASSPAVSDAAWVAVQGRNVEVDTASGSFYGELASSDGDTLVLVQADGEVVTLPKADAVGVRVVKAPASGGAAPLATQPTPETTPAESMAALDAAPADPAAEEPAAEEEELTAAEQRRKDRRDKREHALLGAFAMHGATYSHWRGDGINAGHASYAMDWGVGANLSPRFGMYAMAGGLLGAKIEGGETKANYGHIAALFTFGGEHYFTTAGAGVAFSRLRYRDTTLDRDRGLALPAKIVGKIKLPHKLYLGIGLTYEFAAVRGFSRFVNAIGGQIVIGRW